MSFLQAGKVGGWTQVALQQTCLNLVGVEANAAASDLKATGEESKEEEEKLVHAKVDAQ